MSDSSRLSVYLFFVRYVSKHQISLSFYRITTSAKQMDGRSTTWKTCKKFFWTCICPEFLALKDSEIHFYLFCWFISWDLFPSLDMFRIVMKNCFIREVANVFLKHQKKKERENHSVQFSSVAQSCPTLSNPINCSMPGLPVHHQLPEFTQTHVHWVGDAIQPSHPLSSPSPPAPNPSQHQGPFQWVNS